MGTLEPLRHQSLCQSIWSTSSRSALGSNAMIDLDWLIAHGRSHLFSTYAFHNHMCNQTWACCARWPCTRAPVAPAPDEPLCSTRACARLAPAPHPRPRSTRVRAPPAPVLHTRLCPWRARACRCCYLSGVRVPRRAATCSVFVFLSAATRPVLVPL